MFECCLSLFWFFGLLLCCFLLLALRCFLARAFCLLLSGLNFVPDGFASRHETLKASGSTLEFRLALAVAAFKGWKAKNHLLYLMWYITDICHAMRGRGT